MQQIYVLNKGSYCDVAGFKTKIILASLDKELLQEKVDFLNKLEDKDDQYGRSYYSVGEIETV